jgi:L,D-transpeptidase catalytic domain
MKPRLLLAAGAVLGTIALGGALAYALVTFGGAGRNSGGPGTPRSGISPDGPSPRSEPRRPVPTLASQPQGGRYFEVVSLRDDVEVPLYANPGGKLLRSVNSRSEFGSPRVLAVARQRGPWLGVITPLLPDGELGWVRYDPAKLDRYWTRYSLRILLSKREMQLRYGDRLLGRYTVTIGTTASATPEGHFAITDALDFGESPDYGCCALALSGHQSHLPVGWLGGDRIAIHGTPGPVGEAASHGCIRATDATMHTLFRRVPLGTPVFIS